MRQRTKRSLGLDREIHLHEHAPHEAFAYLIHGAFDCRIDNEAGNLDPGDVLHIPNDAAFSLAVTRPPARWIMFEPTSALERLIDSQ